MNDPHLIEQPIKLSDSTLWEIQQRYFAHQGVQAFEQSVPFYVSSNCYIATRYAELILTFIKSWVAKNPAAREQTFNLLELGAGTGKFSAYFLRAFSQLTSGLDFELKWCYLITDQAEKNIDYIQAHPQIQPFIDAQQVRFALLNVATADDETVQSLFPDHKAEQPLLLVANYVFDCLKQDLFRVSASGLEVAHLELKSRYEDFDKAAPTRLQDLRFNFSFDPIESIEHFYENDLLNKMLMTYPSHLEPGVTFPLPLAAFTFIEQLQQYYPNLMMVLGDKGLSSLNQFPIASANDHLSYDGCYSFLVNFHALGTYCLNLKGDYLRSTFSNRFKVNVCTLGFTLDEHQAVKQYHQYHIDCCSADDFCSLMTNIETSAYRYQANALLAFLRMSHWDPDVFVTLHQHLLNNLETLGPLAKNDLLEDLKRVEANIYAMKGQVDPYLALGVFYQRLEMNAEAKACYQASLTHCGTSSVVHHNLGLLEEAKSEKTQAVEHFQAALALNPSDHYAKQQVHRLEGRFFAYLWPTALKLTLVMGALVGLYWMFNQ